MDTKGDRLRLLRKNKLKLNQADFSEKLKMSPSNISRYEKNEYELTDRTISDICREFNVNENWLRTGEGEIFIELSNETLDVLAREHDLDNNDVFILGNYLKLTKAKRELLKDLLCEIFYGDVDPENEVGNKQQPINFNNEFSILELPLYDFNEIQNELSKNNLITLPKYEVLASAGLGSYIDVDTPFVECKFKLTEQTRKADHALTISGDSMQPIINDNDTVFIREQPTVDNGEIGIFVYDGEIYCKRLILDGSKVILHSENPKYNDIIVNKNLEFVTVGKVLL